MSEGTFAGTRGNDDNAPIAAVRRTRSRRGPALAVIRDTPAIVRCQPMVARVDHGMI